jgi:hypothetical protein
VTLATSRGKIARRKTLVASSGATAEYVEIIDASDACLSTWRRALALLDQGCPHEQPPGGGLATLEQETRA